MWERELLDTLDKHPPRPHTVSEGEGIARPRSTMTAQETFDAICTGLAKQSWRGCMDKAGTCRYRQEGRGCAIGVLLDDATAEAWDKLADSEGAVTVGGSYPTVRNWLTEHGYDADVAQEAQITHDTAPGRDLRAQFVALAEELGLAFPECL